MNKRGMTLMELLVYMAIIGIVVVIAGQAFSDSTKMRIRTENKLKAIASAEDIGSLFRDDLAQMGAKSAVDVDNSSEQGDAFVNKDLVFMPTAAGASHIDKSSFSYVRNHFGVGLDSLTFRRLKYDENGGFVRVEEVAWYATDEGELFRKCSVVPSSEDGDEECPSNVVVADGVTKFVTLPAKPGVVNSDYAGVAGKQFPQLLPNGDLTTSDFRLVSRYGEDGFAFVSTTDPGSSVTISGFASNYDYENSTVRTSDIVANQVFVAPATNDIGEWKDLCKVVDSLEAGVEYEISFMIPFIATENKMFCPGRDHMAVGFRYQSGGGKITGLNDFLFYPPATADASQERRFRFTPAKTAKNVCMAFTFVSYSPLANVGSVTINSLKLNRVATSNYVFNDSFVHSVEDKENVKAFRLELQVESGGETGVVSLVIPTPSNGIKD